MPRRRLAGSVPRGGESSTDVRGKSGGGETYATPPSLTSVKVAPYQGMREQGVGKAEMSCPLGYHVPQVDRTLDVRRRSRLDVVDARLGAIGRILHVMAAVAPDPGVAATRE